MLSFAHNSARGLAFLQTNRFHALWQELRRRRVFRVGIGYIAAVWLIAAGGADLFGAFGVPDWGLRLFVLLGALGLPVVLWLTWMFQMTPAGVVRDHGEDSPATILSHLGVDHLPGGVAAAWKDMDGTAHKRSFRSRFRIGRDSRCEVRLDSRQVSRTHAEIYPDDGVWWIRDLGSTNGTFVDGEAIENAPLPPQALVSCALDGPQITLRIETSVDTTQAMPSIRSGKKRSGTA